ncbi:MAG: VOC family protein [Planctomycetes bacterium]|nr:VOC family protein [Planctomycetota bacterium]
MLDHIGIDVADYPAARAFYERALAPLGLSVVMSLTKEQTGSVDCCGFGRGGKPEFWLGQAAPGDAVRGELHVAFAAPDRAAVDAFHAAALAAGGQDNGAPGLRPEYHPTYYGAFVLDLDGHNIEAVCHAPA